MALGYLEVPLNHKKRSATTRTYPTDVSSSFTSISDNTLTPISSTALWESVRDVKEADDRGRTLLYVASRKGKTQFVKKALKFSSGDTVDMCNQSGERR